MRLKLLFTLLFAGGLAFSGCKDKPKAEVSETAKAEAASFFAEAEFAMKIGEFERARDLLNKAVAARDDLPRYWLTLGIACRRLDDKSGARKAYEAALKLHEERYEEKKQPEDLASQAWVTGLLGKSDQALKILEKGVKAHPESEVLRKASDERGFRHTFGTPQFKEISL